MVLCSNLNLSGNNKIKSFFVIVILILFVFNSFKMYTIAESPNIDLIIDSVKYPNPALEGDI